MKLAAIAGLLALWSVGCADRSIAAPILIFDGYALKEVCADGTAYYTYGKCAGYIIGVHDQYVLAIGDEVNICISLQDGNTVEAMIGPVTAYLDSNRTRLFAPASRLVIEALKEAFPCR